MLNLLFMLAYIIFAVAGSTLIKLGSLHDPRVLFTVPVINMRLTTITLLGIIAYGVSFLLYIVLLTRFDLSFISPLLIAFVYLLLMLTAFLIFKESFTAYKIVGCSLILVGVILVLLRK